MLQMLHFIVILILFTSESTFSNEITKKVFSDDVDGLISAFGDFNADKLTDVFFITESGTKIEIYKAQEKEPLLNKSGISCSFKDYVITSSVPGDFDGDSYMDVLITLKNEKQENQTIFKILWGNSTHFLNCTLGEEERLEQVLRDQPLILDYNGDTIPDIYGQLPNGTRQVWILKKNHTYTEIINSHNQIRIPHSNAFLDLNGDLVADILVTLDNKSFEIWYKDDGGYNSTGNPIIKNFTVPNVSILGQSAFLDMNCKGVLDHIVPVCFDADCKNSSIYVNRSGNQWLRLINSFQDDDNFFWGFVHNKFQPATLRIGDYNLDGHPDVVAVLYKIDTSTNHKIQRAVLLENKECKSCPYPRKLEPQWRFPGLNQINNVTHVTFYDIYQDGNLDFLLVNETYSDGKIKKTVSAVQNVITTDVCFIKVLVSSGLCDQSTLKSKPYGVNQPGPFVQYKTTRADGSPQISCAAQLSQSAYFALQIPYTVFGLGQTPNFVDDLVVGIPYNTKQENYHHSWLSIIPNSQMIVIALKGTKGNYQWINRLFVTPSHQVLLTFIALIGTCALVVIVIGGLHWKEKVADKKEKLQEAHKFHFDAM